MGHHGGAGSTSGIEPVTSGPAARSPAARGGPRSVLSLGETLVDLIVTDGSGSLEGASGFVARLGGAPANAAVALARLGVESAFAGVVGDDPFGRRLRSGLAAEGVDISRLRATTEAATTLAFAWKDDRGDGRFWLLRGADLRLSAEDVAAAGLAEMAAIVVGSVALAGEPSRSAIGRAVAVAATAGVPVCFDVNLRPSLWPDLESARAACAPVIAGSTLLKLSVDDARGILGLEEPAAIIAALRQGGERTSQPPLVVLTDGERGCWFAAGGEGSDAVRHVPAFSVAAVEPTGAGDAFTAALLARLLERGWGEIAEEDVRSAAAAGALATTREGAWEGLPTAAELDAFLSLH